MAKLILKLKQRLPYDEIERLENRIKKELNENGFAVVDADTVDIYEIDDDKPKGRAE